MDIKKLGISLVSLAFITFAPVSFAQFFGTGQKIAIIDSAVLRAEAGFSRSIFDEQLCFSRADDLVNSEQVKIADNTIPTLGPSEMYRHYTVASTCKNGVEKDYSSSDAAEGQRQTWHYRPLYDWHFFGLSHGTNVTLQVLDNARDVKIISVNSAFYSAKNKFRSESNDEQECGFHGTDTRIPLLSRPSEKIACYSVSDAFHEPEVFDRIIARGNVAAINISSGNDQTSCSSQAAFYASIKNRGVAVVAAVGNGGVSARVGFPACDQSVISVGALDGPNGNIASYTSQNGHIDFLANGTMENYTKTNFISGTSFAAPIVTAAFAVMREAKPNATIDQMVFALTTAAFKKGLIRQHRGRDVPIVSNSIILDAAACLVSGECLIGGTDETFTEVNYFDGGQYGSIFGDDSITEYEFQIDFDSLNVGIPSAALTLADDASVNDSSQSSVNLQQSQNSTSIERRRDVVLKFASHLGGSNNFRVTLNNSVSIGQTSTYSNGVRQHEFMINRNMLRNGSNSITITPNRTSAPWGLSEVSAEFNPVVPLTINQVDDNEYGYQKTPPRYTGMRASFNLSSVSQDYLLSVTGWDIDLPSENEVFLNGTSLGFLSEGPGSSEFSPRDTFTLKQADLIEGANIIEFVQRLPDSEWSGFEDEKWFVTGLHVREANSDLVASSFSLLDRRLKPNVPFNVLARIENRGVGRSSVSTIVRYYVSNDTVINANDIQIGTSSLPPLNAGRSIELTKSLQTNLVNEGKYIGYCVDAVPNDLSRSNNCSTAVSLRNNVVIAPIIMLLLE